jgi:hypothetical protein
MFQGAGGMALQLLSMFEPFRNGTEEQISIVNLAIRLCFALGFIIGNTQHAYI